MKLSLSTLQPLGRALMLPIAVLPIAGLLLRLGQADLLDVPFMAAAGQAVFANLGLLFAIGVAVGLARDNNGAAGLAGAVCFVIALEGAKALVSAPPETGDGLSTAGAALAVAAFKDQALTRLGVPIGIVSGLLAGAAYNRFGELKLPEYLAFFGGRRFVPIVSGFAGLLLAGVVGLSWSALDAGIEGLSRGVVGSGEFGLFAFGVLNRVLIVTGLHHILNNIAWFIVGEHAGATGDLNRFFAGDPTAGAFMAGFFPVMMFGLPAACLAMYHTARPERRKAVGGMLFSLALMSFLTGVTEPIEFTFMFLAPVLYAVHACMTGLAMVIMSLLEVRLGFSFSAGLFDYVINFGRSQRPWLLLPVGAAYFALYYGVFRFFIVRFDLKTPGRELGVEAARPAETQSATPARPAGAALPDRSGGFVAALGGATNLQEVGACTTRLRLVLRDRTLVDAERLKQLGAHGLVWPSPLSLQVVLGPRAEAVAEDIRRTLAEGDASAAAVGPADPMIAALGGIENVRAASVVSGRLLLTVHDASRVRDADLVGAGARAVARLSEGCVHVLFAPSDRAAPQALVELLQPAHGRARA